MITCPRCGEPVPKIIEEGTDADNLQIHINNFHRDEPGSEDGAEH